MFPQLVRVVISAVLLTVVSIGADDERIITTLQQSGRRRMQLTIMDGRPVSKGTFPFLVSIKEPYFRVPTNRTVWRNLCGGSILGPIKILTAAHCFESKSFYYARNPGILRVVAGNLSSELMLPLHGLAPDNDDGQWRVIKRVKLHKDFHFPENDIALAFLETPFVFNKNVQSVVPAKYNVDYPRVCLAAGYGRIGPTYADPVAPQLLMGRISVMPRWKCSALWQMDMNKFVCSDSVLSDVSMGDSGGPLLCSQTMDPTEPAGAPLLVGVVSGKNVDRSTLFTRVSAFRDWIDANRSVTLVATAAHVYLTVVVFVLVS